MSDPKDKAAGLGGLLLIGCVVIGLASLLLAFLALVNEGDYMAGGVALIAAAVAFGFGVNAVFRE
jgi:hypothetical protein